ncbi:MAG: 16S rRNA (guanine(966)-N(2))-methyltransferase RsmD [Acidobacteria bacterium]|nr:16S rRNA (guanine(966)-N(2))-methyltransferase RsmD [Acidobacteriota bacterium]MBU4494649.1 16S rRNA (guanine(966)-N(2))-methyltransferase RsmD [Acidobacteriota bacterium]MCG2814834.1 16S rRNA (guanine(966)-N(2))-methyltransferase RsmD [Candidatus Aminicenantes bacterium]
MIRVVAGLYKGKRLKRVPSPQVRPMPQKLKESLFSMIQEDLPGSLVLDGFAGTGSIGIEALSRGARTAVFLEEFYPAVQAIRENVARCGAEEGARIVHREFNRGVIQLAEEGARFDLIFLDPPYRLLNERDPLKVISKRDILAENGTIILRHFFKTDFDSKYYRRKKCITRGDDTLVFYTG